MKITRIEGHNLASYREFDLQLNSGVLGEVSVFAIVGRTGAGKSTLLDAVLLALFGELPRAAQQKSLDLGQGYDAGKPVAIVRRGQSEAHAACEFIATDGRSYRSVWRVKKKRDGSLNEPKPELFAVGEELPLVRTKGEHKDKIEELVGINATEFRRAALLAQNDFAAFLRADREERAKQLERITRQEQYAAIGMKVHTLKAAREAEVAQAKALLGVWSELTPEGEAALRLAVSDAEAAQGARAAEVQRLAEHRRYLEARTAHEAAVRAATEAEERARGALEARQGDVDRLARADAAEVHQPAWEAWRRAERAEAEAGAEAERRAQEASAAVGVRAAAAEARERTAAEAARARCALDPRALAVARAADERVVGFAAQAASEAEAVRRAEADHAQAVAAVEAARPGVASAERHLAAIEARLAALAGVAAVRADEGAVGVLEGWIVARIAASAALAEAREAAAKAVALAARLEAGAVRRAQAAERVEAAAKAVGAAGAAPDTAAASQAAAAARLRAGRAEAVRTRQAAVERVRVERERWHRELTELEGWIAGYVQRAPALAAAVAAAEAAAAGAERVVQAMKAVMSLEAHRAQLAPGEACPLCGSEAHPYAEAGAPRLQQSAEVELQRLKEAQAARVREAATASGEAEGWRAREPSARARLAEAAASLSEAETALAAAVFARAGDGELPSAAEGAAEVQAAEAASQAAEAGARAVAAAMEGAAAAARELAEVEKALAPLEAERGAAAALAAAAERAAERASVGEAEAGAEARRRFAAWPAGLDLEAADARDRVLEGFRVLAEARAALQPAELRLGEARGAEKAAAEAAAGAWRLVEEARSRAQAAALTLVEARRARAPLLGGLSTAEAVAAWEQATERADLAASRAAAEATAAVARAESTAAEAVAAEARRLQAVAVRTEAWALVEAALLALGWSAAAFEAALLPSLDRSDLRAQLGRLREAVTVAATTLSECVRRGGLLVAPEGLDEAGLSAAEEASRLALHAAQAEASAAAAALRQALRDQELRRTQGGEVERLEAAARPWQRLADLIGGHEGKKFRELAQARTMQALAELANDQLQRFAARYELRHLPEHPLELLVLDHDAGGEVRATSSLSGGETFMVSLALALALGRLSKRSLHLRTLFVDEGFGSLDADSVDPVIDALRSLADGGVQVGLISHVRGIAERLPARVEVVKSGQTSSIRVVRA